MNKEKIIAILLIIIMITMSGYIFFDKENLGDKFLQCKAYTIIDRFKSDGSNVYTSYALVIKKQDFQNAESTFSGSIVTKRDNVTITQNIFASNYFTYEIYDNRIDVFTRNVVIRLGNTANEKDLQDYVSASLKSDSRHSYSMFFNERNILSFGEANFPRVVCGNKIVTP